MDGCPIVGLIMDVCPIVGLIVDGCPIDGLIVDSCPIVGLIMDVCPIVGLIIDGCPRKGCSRDGFIIDGFMDALKVVTVGAMVFMDWLPAPAAAERYSSGLSCRVPTEELAVDISW